jgi:hypothetical protein
VTLQFEGDHLSRQQLVDINNRFQRILRTEGLVVLEETVDFAADLIIDLAKLYPPEPPGTRYGRTGHLRDSFEKETYTGILEAVAIVRNTATYASHVIGKGTQTKVSKDAGWNTLEDIAEAVVNANNLENNRVTVERVGTARAADRIAAILDGTA